MFEYLVIKDKNDSLDAAKKLVKLLDGIQAKVNLIYFNPYPGTTYQRPLETDMMRFKDFLNSKGVICTIRESKGLDISAACGQLKECKNTFPYLVYKSIFQKFLYSIILFLILMDNNHHQHT